MGNLVVTRLLSNIKQKKHVFEKSKLSVRQYTQQLDAFCAYHGAYANIVGELECVKNENNFPHDF